MSSLNKIIIRGFKSFKNETSIQIPKNGLTAIVGENGSGKSNLVDAITFVLGRRSSKLRAERLPQLIYNGGENGSPAKKAKVQLEFDNRNGTFDPIFKEVSTNGHDRKSIKIGRKITQNSSTYTFMGKNCKYSVVEDILNLANIDESKQNIINQGKITEIVNMRAQKRREIIDELAGISDYEKKKRRAISDLREVKEKLMTNRVILGERRGQLNRLRKERETALSFQKKEKELDTVKDSIIQRKRNNKIDQINNYRKKFEEIKNEVSALEEELEEKDKKGEKLERNLSEMRDRGESDRDQELQNRIEQIKMDLVKKRGEINSKEKEIENLKETIQELKNIRANQKKMSSRSSKSRAVKELLKRDRGGVYGTIEGLMEVEPKYQIAIETAAGGHLNDLIVDSRATAIESVNYLKKNKIGRARFLPLRRISEGRKSPGSKKALKLDGVIGYAIDLVDFQSKYRRAFSYVFRDTLVAENLEAVEQVDNVRVVTLDGDVLSRGGAISGGNSKKRKKKSNHGNKNFQEKIDSKNKRIKALQKEIKSTRRELSELSEKLEELEEKKTKKTKENRKIKKEIEQTQKELDKIKKRRKELYRKLEKARSKKSKFDKEIGQLESELEGLPTIEEGKEIIDEPVQDLIKKKRRLQRELDKLKPVNMKSIEEYEEFKEKVEELENKISLLREEKREVERLIGDIERKKKEQFYSKMEVLSDNFGDIFERLFQGGSAHLELEEEGNIESGLLIKAHPPGKELNVLSSLSGGEKSLTAIAFIFAVQELSPSPFYIMDEIDAALDKRRSRRLAQLLEEYSEESQLILISHNEETAKHARALYGVSMTDSQSRVLSVELN